MSISGLYAIADTAVLSGSALGSQVEKALRGGAGMLQYRDKRDDTAADLDRRRREACELAALAREFGAPFIVNDDPQLARDCRADGVHLGVDDGIVSDARAVIGRSVMVGVSCYNDILRAQAALAAGADYVAFGSFYPSRVKPGAVRASSGLIRAARKQIDLPIVAIGGIDVDNARRLLAAGAAAIAVISGLFACADVEARANAFAALFNVPGRK